MHGVALEMTKARKRAPPKPVVIEYLRLANELAEPGSAEAKRIKDINRVLAEGARRSIEQMRRGNRTGERAATDEAGTPVTATTLTAFRLRGSPLATLINGNARRKAADRAGGDELQAAMEIETAFMAIAGGSMFKPLNLERVDRSYSEDWPERTAIAVRRYQAFANHWSKMRKQSADRTLEVVVAAIIDQRPFSGIENDIGLRHGTAQLILVRGLRDYAARAGWVDRKTGDRWKLEADVGTKQPVGERP